MAKRSRKRLPAAPPVTLLPGETIEGYRRHRESWFEEFPPDSDLETDFVERLCERSWLLIRCERLYNDAVAKTMLAHPDATNWSPETHKLLQLLDRYRLSADRAYRAAWRDIETLRKNRVECVVHVEKLKRLVFLNRRSGIGPRPAAPNPDSPNRTQENPFVKKEQTPPPLERNNNDTGEFPPRDRRPE